MRNQAYEVVLVAGQTKRAQQVGEVVLVAAWWATTREAAVLWSLSSGVSSGASASRAPS
ncbi:hypothetical protein [Streptomyces sp. NPDC056661]|uniref:hypothetical protein n=1 Tax=Streptomyces sp. NPDC056661 TaxID=3345898 RepID=UPI003675718A